MDDMLDTMYAAPGIGLAAIQIGVPKRVIAIDLSRRKKIHNFLSTQKLSLILIPKHLMKKGVYLYLVNLQK